MTASDIDAFEGLFGLPVNGKLNIDSWPTLVAQVTPLVAGESTGLPVEALQDLLLASGTASVDLAVNGVFDAATVDAPSTRGSGGDAARDLSARRHRRTPKTLAS